MTNIRKLTKFIALAAIISLSFPISTLATAYTSYYVDENSEVKATTVDITSDLSTRLVDPSESSSYDFEGITTAGSAANTGGGALRNTNSNGVTITGDFAGNTFTRTNDNNYGGGGAVYNSGTLVIEGNFIDNTLTNGHGNAAGVGGGAIYNQGTLTVTGDFSGNEASGSGNRGGGAIFNNTASATINITGSFYNNSTIGSKSAGGGAIYNVLGTVNLNASSSNIYFIGNTASTVSNAIYNTGTVNFNAGSYKIVVNDGISGTSAGSLKINSGTTVFNNAVSTQKLVVANGATLTLGSYAGSELLGVSASSASISNSTITLEEGSTLSFAATTGKSTISFSENTWSIATSGETILANAALDLSGITGTFELTLDFSEDSSNLDTVYDFLNNKLDVVFGDSTLNVEYNEQTDSYTASDLESGFSADFTVSLGGNSIVIAGTAVPEPSTYAMIIGALALAFAYYKRRK